jgi:glycosyl transferase family 25
MPPWKINEIPAMCISLKRREDRWARFKGQPAVRDLTMLQRFDAVDGQTIDVATDKRILVTTKRNILKKQRRSHEELDSKGGVGCALSHIGIWQQMVQRQIPLLLVIEDDAKIPNDFVEKVNAIIAKSPTLQNTSGWDYWALATKIRKQNPIERDPVAFDLESFVGSIAYVITLQGATKLLENVFPIHCHIDMYMVILKEIRPMKYIVTPSFTFYQFGVDSSDIAEKSSCLICDIPTDFDKTHVLVNKAVMNNLEAIKTIFVLSVAFGGGYLLYKRFGGKAI